LEASTSQPYSASFTTRSALASKRLSVVFVDFMERKCPTARITYLPMLTSDTPVPLASKETVPAAPALQIYSQEDSEMPRTSDPMETAMLDLGVFRHEMVKHFSSDQHIDPDEHRLIKLFDAPYKEASRINRCWTAFTALMRNGLTRHTNGLAKDAELTIVVDNTGKVSNVIPFPGAEDRSFAG
jgi:hypothetical protein